MNQPPIAILRQLMIDRGLGTADGVWPVTLASMPADGADEVLTIYDTAGTLDGVLLRTGKTIEHPGIQLRVRSLDYPTGWAKAKAVADDLGAAKNQTVTVEGEQYKINSIRRTSGVLVLGREELGLRQLFTVNFILTIQEF